MSQQGHRREYNDTSHLHCRNISDFFFYAWIEFLSAFPVINIEQEKSAVSMEL